MTTVTPPSISDLDELSGYRTADQYLASRFWQGGRSVYTMDLAVPQLVSTLPKPDPHKQLDGNRKINEKHAQGFARYVRENEGAVVPPLLLRAPQHTLEFEPLQSMGGTEVGVLTIPRLAKADLKIIDGQHRVLGFHLAIEQQSTDLSFARGAVAQKRTKSAVRKKYESEVKRLLGERERINRERVAIQIVIVEDPTEFKQIFVDIADNAKGITRTITSLFDNRRIVNRCIDDVLEHPLLTDRVDLANDQIRGDNENLMGARHVGDVIRTLQVGVTGRITERRERELDEATLIESACAFFDALVDGFDDLAHVMDGSTLVPDLRKRSLLASVAFQRVLAGAYHNLVLTPAGDQNMGTRMRQSEIIRFFRSIAPHMTAPVDASSPWVLHTEQFDVGDVALRGRSTDLKALTATITGWAVNRPEWLEPMSTEEEQA